MTAKRAIRLLIGLSVLPLPAVLAAVDAPAPPGASLTALRCGHLLDPASGRTTENAVVLVREGRIESVTQGTALPPGARFADLSSYTCLPGLI
ncbi:MAG TPA: amidohydrolase family protein, partial [Thermoanaerobaculia bacterium]